MVPTRRALLRTGGSAVALALAGCTTTDVPAGTPTDSPTRTPTGPSRTTDRRAGVPPLAIADAETAFVAADGGVRALAAGDGSERWRTTVGDATALHRTSDDLFVLARDGTVVSLAPTAGSERWRATLGERGVSLTAARDAVVVVGADGAVVAFDGSGDERWRATVDGTPQGVTADADRVYVTTDSWLYAFADGSEQWSAYPGTEVTTPPARIGEHVLVGAVHPGATPGDETPTAHPTDAAVEGGAIAYTRDGDADWTADIEGRPAWFVGTADGPLVGYRGFRFATLDVEPQVSGLDADGRERWRREQAPFDGAAAVTAGVALVVDLDAPEVHEDSGGDRQRQLGHAALATDSGELRWERADGAATAAAAGDRFVTVTGSAVHARGALTGTEQWTTER